MPQRFGSAERAKLIWEHEYEGEPFSKPARPVAGLPQMICFFSGGRRCSAVAAIGFPHASRRWILIDCDALGPKKTSATDKRSIVSIGSYDVPDPI